MDILKLLSTWADSTWANKNFIALVVIAYQLRSQKLIFNGMFNVQDIKIKHIDEKATEAKKESGEAKKESGEALEIAQRVETCSGKIQQTVMDIKTGYQEFMNKHGKEVDAEKN